MSGRPDIIYCLVRRGHAVHYHSDRSVFERWLEKDSWQYPPDECEIIPYVPASGELDAETLERAAQVAESTPAYGDPVEISVGLGPVGERIASAIRALKDSQPQTERQAE